MACLAPICDQIGPQSALHPSRHSEGMPCGHRGSLFKGLEDRGGGGAECWVKPVAHVAMFPYHFLFSNF